MKRFILTVAMGIILFSVCAAAKAECSLSLSYSDGYVKISEKSPTGSVYSGTVIAVSSEEGKVKKVKTYENVSGKVFVNDDFYNGEKVKLMYWGDIDTMNPIADTAEAVIEGTNDAPKSVTLSAEDFDFENSAYENGYTKAGKLYFFSGGQTQAYAVSENVKLKVNGFEYSDINEGIDKYVAGNYMSNVVLTDYAGEDGSPDGKYDEIAVDYYTAMVVEYISMSPSGNYVNIDAVFSETGEKYWSFFLQEGHKFIKNGQEIPVSDIAVNDILLIKHDVNKSIKDSYSCEILVSSEFVRGQVTAYSEETGTYTVDGKEYALRDKKDMLNIGSEYKLYIDAFGKIAWYEEIIPAKQLAVIDAVYTIANGDSAAKLILPDGTAGEYVFRKADNAQIARSIVYADESTFTKNPVYDRVVEYSLNQENKLTVKENLRYLEVKEGEYVKKSSRIGTAKISIDDTSFLEIDDAENIIALNANTLVDGSVYTAYAYDKSADSTYRFVLISSGIGNYTTATRLAVFNKVFETLDDNDNAVDALSLFVNGEEVTYSCEDGVDADLFDLSVGDVILCKTNSDNEIADVKKVYTATSDWNAALTSTAAQIADGKAFVSSLTGRYDADLYLGAVISRNSDGSVDISAIENNISSADGENFIFAEDVQVYVVDYNQKPENRVRLGSVSSIIKTNISNDAYVDYDRAEIDWSKNGIHKEPRLALIKTVDDDASDIVYIIPKSE